jgi:hypothetical protein
VRLLEYSVKARSIIVVAAGLHRRGARNFISGLRCGRGLARWRVRIFELDRLL